MMTSAEEKTCLHGIISDQVEVLISARHGEGLFAKTKLQQNTFIHVTHVHRDILNDPGLPAPANASWQIVLFVTLTPQLVRVDRVLK